MPKLKPETQRARIEHILDAAELCFAREGFHACTMAEICQQAGVSPGALYGHFDSKEDLINGIAERNRSKFADELKELSSSNDILGALNALGEHYAIEEPKHKRILCIEIGVESTRNDKVGETFRSVDRFVKDSFEQLFERALKDGKINPSHDPKMLANLLCLLGDGLFWRRAVDPDFDVKTAMPAVMALVATLLNPTPDADSTATHANLEPKQEPSKEHA